METDQDRALKVAQIRIEVSEAACMSMAQLLGEQVVDCGPITLHNSEARVAMMQARIAALESAALAVKDYLIGLQASTDMDDPLYRIRRRYHDPLIAQIDASLTADPSHKALRHAAAEALCHLVEEQLAAWDALYPDRKDDSADNQAVRAAVGRWRETLR